MNSRKKNMFLLRISKTIPISKKIQNCEGLSNIFNHKKQENNIVTIRNNSPTNSRRAVSLYYLIIQYKMHTFIEISDKFIWLFRLMKLQFSCKYRADAERAKMSAVIVLYKGTKAPTCYDANFYCIWNGAITCTFSSVTILINGVFQCILYTLHFYRSVDLSPMKIYSKWNGIDIRIQIEEVNTGSSSDVKMHLIEYTN